jgi:two-component system sensor histidine kinase/response regulator
VNDQFETEQLRGLRVLVVDNNATNCQVVDEMLQGWHMKTTLAHRGQRAVEILKAIAEQGEPLSLVVLNARCPKKTALRLQNRFSNRPRNGFPSF